jgi:hypothetical protein
MSQQMSTSDTIRLSNTTLSLRELAAGVQEESIIIPNEVSHRTLQPRQEKLLIESILLEFPLPPMFMRQDREGVCVVLTGYAWLLAIVAYMDNDYALEHCFDDPLHSANTEFASLPMQYKRRLQQTSIACSVLQHCADDASVESALHRIRFLDQL